MQISKEKVEQKEEAPVRIEVGLLPESKRDGMRTPQCRKDASAGPAIYTLYYYHIMLLLSIVVTMLFGSNVFRVTSFFLMGWLDKLQNDKCEKM